VERDRVWRQPVKMEGPLARARRFREAEMMQWGRDWLAAARICGFLELGDPFNSDTMHSCGERSQSWPICIGDDGPAALPMDGVHSTCWNAGISPSCGK
jgi:hypothetical protein